jgi:hypothetical protein
LSPTTVWRDTFVLRSVCRLAKIIVVSAGIPSGWVDNVRHLCSIVLVGDNTNKDRVNCKFIFQAQERCAFFKRENAVQLQKVIASRAPPISSH